MWTMERIERAIRAVENRGEQRSVRNSRQPGGDIPWCGPEGSECDERQDAYGVQRDLGSERGVDEAPHQADREAQARLALEARLQVALQRLGDR